MGVLGAKVGEASDETTKGFDPLKGLAVIVYIEREGGGEDCLSLRVLFNEAFGETPRELD